MSIENSYLVNTSFMSAVLHVILVFLYIMDQVVMFLLMLLWSFSMMDCSWSGSFLMVDSNLMVSMVIMSIFILGLVIFSESNNNLIFLSITLVIISIAFFCSMNLIMLYIFFEMSMFPIVIMILGYGFQIEKISSSYYLMFYSTFCSMPFLYVYFIYDINLAFVYFDKMISWELAILLTLGFMMKFPVYFLHMWLPKAHVEAPTSASMLLAGLLLKLGTVGFVRVMGSLSYVNSGLWLFLAFLGMVLGAFSCIFQSDAKSLAAYSSITHMSFVLLSLMFMSMETKFSSLLIMLGHGFTSTLMFYFIGELYHSLGSRMIYYMSGLMNSSLIFMVLICLVFLSNAGVPPFINFFAEFVTISLGLSLYKVSILVMFLYFFFGFYYSIYFVSNVVMGKNYVEMTNWVSYNSYFMVLMMINIFWLSFVY